MSRRRRDSSEEFQEYMGDLWEKGDVQFALALQHERDERNGERKKKKPKQEQEEAKEKAEVPKTCDTDAEIEERESRIRELRKNGDYEPALRLQEEQNKQLMKRMEKLESERREAKKKESEQERLRTWAVNEEEWDTESGAESSGVGTTDEEDPEDVLDEAKEVQTKEEEKVHAAAEELRNEPSEQRRVGDIRGKWSLYSSEWLEKYVNELGQSLDDYDCSSGVGTIEFGKHLIGEAEAPWAGDMGMKLDIEDKVSDASPKHFNKPKYASLDPETLDMYDEGNEEYFSIEINFLGNGYLEMRMDDVYFAGIHVQGKQAVEREAEEASIEWQNDRYTGHLHPANNMGMKMYMAECGVYDDLGSSDSGDFGESNATGSEGESQEGESQEEEEDDDDDDDDEEDEEDEEQDEDDE